MADLDRIRAGDEGALADLVAEVWKPLVLYLRGILGGEDSAEDAAQEALIRFWEHRGRWTSGSARAVVFRIGRNVALDLNRQVRARTRRAVDGGDLVAPAPSGPEQDAAASELRLLLAEAIESLPPRRREVFELVRFRGLAYREVGEILGLSTQTVANHLTLAHKDLRRFLKDPSGRAATEGEAAEDRRSSGG